VRDSERHPGISIHRMAIGGGIMSGLFAIGTVLIFVIGTPLGPWFLLASVLLGAGVAAALYVWHKRHPVEIADLHHPPQPEK
jgi:F0F1-type ATP synthase assembly protein I